MSYYDNYGAEDVAEVAADEEILYEHVGTSRWFMLLPVWNAFVLTEYYPMTKVGTYEDGPYDQYWIPVAYTSACTSVMFWGMWQNSKAEYYWPHLKKMYLFALFA